MKRADIQARASEAETLLAHPLLKRAREDVKAGIVSRMVHADSNPEADHEWANLLRAGEAYWRMLEGYLRTGNVELVNSEPRKDIA